MITFYNESSLNNSEVFNGINNIDDKTDVLKTKVINTIKTAKALTNEDIEAAYVSVKQITEGLTRESIKAFDDGRIVLLHNHGSSITQALPFITFKSKSTGKYITYVFMDRYIQIRKDGVLSLKPTDLRDLLAGALIANTLKTNYNDLASNIYLQKLLTNLYSQFVMRILNREFSIAADRNIYDTVIYWTNKFFLYNILQANDSDENLENIAKNSFKYIDELKYDEIKNAYNEANPTKISDLINLIKTASPRMVNLDFRLFFSNWMQYYYTASVLAIDNIEYFIFMVLTALNSNSAIISIAANDVVKDAKNIKILKSELLKLI